MAAVRAPMRLLGYVALRCVALLAIDACRCRGACGNAPKGVAERERIIDVYIMEATLRDKKGGTPDIFNVSVIFT